ncbi:hypothetical protein P691DRAFT_759224 [Macrolepiota fuliginosa MF-IS2]|uniref:DUF6533 domain-containing protein n=1 Tax=Macrolepiota fuliginosa MF-IS2 TaxID=1400762 RepID=A0A9P5XH98_9AGAR|nr:hypothetical protein P691DRAFT_759224 [Macrolepiota fuliginosa MF-IS2]
MDIALAWQSQKFAYVQLSIYTIFLHEYISHLPTEIEEIWLAKWNRRVVVKSLYIICRYTTFHNMVVTLKYGMIPAMTDGKQCLTLSLAGVWVTYIGIGCGELTFYLRAYALWQDIWSAKIFIVLLGFGRFGVGIVLASFATRNATLQYTIMRNNSIRSCPVLIPSAAEVAMWTIFAILGSECVLMMLAIGAKIKFQYHLGVDSLTRKIYQDAVYYFFVSLFISVASVLIYFTCSGPLKQIDGVLAATGVRCVACRSILRLRGYDKTGGTGLTTEVTNPIYFVHSMRCGDDSGLFLDSISQSQGKEV